jgi:GNAT superfamily N-acetyltransferase
MAALLDLPVVARAATDDPAATADGTRTTAGWADVADELTRSCTARADEGALLSVPGAVGVLRGTAPIVWVHGETDPGRLAAILATSPEVVEVSVRAEDVATTRLLEATGWRTADLSTQLVHSGLVSTTPGQAPEGYAIVELDVADLPELRTLLATAGDASPELLASCYADDFFVKAAPVWLFGARDESGRLVGCIAVRRQQRSAMLFALAVHEDHRSAGLGRALVAEAVRTGRTNGAEFCHASADAAALPLALSCGFYRVGGWRRLER